ncbi:hypothetical protein NRB56_72600 [Nocardia sp. RB56]|uniref:Uncharacterized protein n=1 Tax=Nocardia aurantia TaxID=2585199 RepID=A0A7K0E198_9NOCA|nr:hypothetical protein [Nocardia aurantia]
MPVTATPMMRAAPRVAGTPRTVRVNHSAAVAATTAITTDTITIMVEYRSTASDFIAYMPE